MSTIIICAVVVVLAGLLCEARLLIANKKILRLRAMVKEREEHLNELGDIANDTLLDLKATYYVLYDKAPDEDIELLIQEKKFKILMEED